MRLHIGPATLRQWRHEFARHLREQGIAANATERAVRGETRTHKTDGVYRATRRGQSVHTRARAESVASELLNGRLGAEPGKSKLIETRGAVECGWRATSTILAAQGHHELASHILRFLAQMPQPLAERERIATALLAAQRELQLRAGPSPMR